MICSAAASTVFQQCSELFFVHLRIQDHESTVDQVLDR